MKICVDTKTGQYPWPGRQRYSAIPVQFDHAQGVIFVTDKHRTPKIFYRYDYGLN